MRAPVRFGLRLPAVLGAAPDALGRLLGLARAAEEAGFDSLWVPDHPAGTARSTERALEAYTMLGALAAVTTTVRLGALASPAGARPPALLAKQVTALDVISGGRAVLGIRTGGAAGTSRYARLEEAASVCRAMFEHEESTVQGRWFRIERAANRPAPLQPGGPAVLMAGKGSRLFLQAVTRVGDAVHLEVRPPRLRRLVADLADEQRRGGRVARPLAVSATLRLPAPAWSGADGGVARATALVGRALSAGIHGVVLDVPAATEPGALAALGAALLDTFGPGPTPAPA